MARRDTPRFHGFLIVDKPAGLTSHDVVSRVRRLTGQRTVGHTGTLDPAATGVLPIALGEATRVLPWTTDTSKTYQAEITLGIETDTLDADGRVTAMSPVNVSLEQIESALMGFIGRQQQVAPRYSAVQVKGKRLYDLARAGVEFDAPIREVEIQQVALLGYELPVLTICVDCGAGTYIRSLARDLGRVLGCGAHLSNLVRLRSGIFSLDDAWTLGQLAALPLEECWPVIAYHPDTVVGDLPAVILDDPSIHRWEQGQSIPLDADFTPGPVRAYSVGGDWLGIGELLSRDDALVIQPRRVMNRDLRLQRTGRETSS